MTESSSISAEKTNTIENDQISVSDESAKKESTSDELSYQKQIKTESSTCNDEIGFFLTALAPNEPSVVSVTSNESSIEKSITDESIAQNQKQNANLADLQNNEEPSNENFTSCLILIFRVEGQVHLSDENVFMVWVDASVSKQSPDP